MKEIDAALYSRLSASATTLYGLIATRVFNTLAPQGTVFPYVVYNRQAGGPANLTPADFVEEVYQVKGIAQSVGAALNIDSAIWERLHNAALSVSGWTAVSCMREGAFDYSELVNGAAIFHKGGLYRIRVSK